MRDDFAPQPDETQPLASESQAALPPLTPRGFSLATLMLIVTVVSITCGLAATAPAIGLPLVYFFPPILVRTAIVLRHKSRETSTLGFKAAMFGQSIGTVLFIAMMAAAMLYGSFLIGVALGGGFLSVIGVDTERFGAPVLFGICIVTWLVVARLTYMLTVQLLGLDNVDGISEPERHIIAVTTAIYVALPLIYAYLLM